MKIGELLIGSVVLKKTKCSDLECLFGENKKALVVERLKEGNKRPTSLRQMPENYCIARFDVGQRYWVIDPDMAANINLVFFVFELLLIHSIKWDATGVILENAIKDAMDGAK